MAAFGVVVKADGVEAVVGVLKAVEVEMVERNGASQVFVNNGIGGAFNAASLRENGGKTANEGGFACSEVTRKANEKQLAAPFGEEGAGEVGACGRGRRLRPRSFRGKCFQ